MTLSYVRFGVSVIIFCLDCKGKAGLEGSRIRHIHGSTGRQGDLGHQITGNTGTDDVVAIILGLDGSDRRHLVR